MENMMRKVNTAIVKESQALQSVKSAWFLKRKTKLYHKRQKESKKSFQFVFNFGVTVYGEGREDKNKREGS